MKTPFSLVRAFHIEGKGKNRRVKCGYCGSWFNVSILPHMRQEHSDIWLSWTKNFVDLWNQGLTTKQIMRKYGTLFTWAVIEKEIQKLAEKNPDILKIHSKRSIKEWRPKHFKLEQSTVWRFTKRGDWAVHTSDYRGNWAPQVPRNLILRYTKKGQTVLDPFVGGGTTLIECYIEGRNGIGLDINPIAIKMTEEKIAELETKAEEDPKFELPKVNIEVRQGDARELDFIETESVDLVCAHPPYANVMRYTYNQVKDLSRIKDIDTFCKEIGKVAQQLLRVLRKGKKCAVLIGDIRKGGDFIPLEHHVMDEFLNVGFKLSERIIKEQHQDKSTAFYLYMDKSGKYRIAHEYLLIFEKRN